MLHNLLFQTLGEFRLPLLAWTAVTVAATWLAVLARPLLMLLGQNLPLALPGPVEWAQAAVLGLAQPVLLAAFAGWYGAALVAGEEERGSLGLLLAGSMLRSRIIVIKFSSLLLLVLLPSLAAWLALSLLGWLGLAPSDPWLAARATLGLALLGLVFGTLALALGCLTGSQRLSRAISLAAMLGSLLVYYLPAGQLLRLVSPFYHYAQILLGAWAGWHAAGLALLVAAGYLLAHASFERRDLAA